VLTTAKGKRDGRSGARSASSHLAMPRLYGGFMGEGRGEGGEGWCQGSGCKAEHEMGLQARALVEPHPQLTLYSSTRP
jgi:hypothetical protein